MNNSAVHPDIHLLVEDLYYLLHQLRTETFAKEVLSSTKLAQETKADIKRRLERMYEELQKVITQLDSCHEGPSWSKLQKKLEDFSQHLEKEWRSSLDALDTLNNPKQKWTLFRARALPLYEDILEKLGKNQTAPPKHRPSNYFRNLYHVVNGIMLIGLVQLVLTPNQCIYVAGGFTILAWSLDLSRHYWVPARKIALFLFKKVMHPHEEWSINSATWLVTALFIISLVTDTRSITLAIAILGFADPVAALVGRRWGKIKLRNNKSAEGSLAFFVMACFTSLAALLYFYPETQTTDLFILAFVASVTGTIAEAISGKIDDNLLIPVSVAMVCMLI